jgi:hypothetical protein
LRCYIKGTLASVCSRPDILTSWHVACGSAVFADGGATSDRYLIALVGHDVEDATTGDLKFIITALPETGALFRAWPYTRPLSAQHEPFLTQNTP